MQLFVDASSCTFYIFLTLFVLCFRTTGKTFPERYILSYLCHICILMYKVQVGVNIHMGFLHFCSCKLHFSFVILSNIKSKRIISFISVYYVLNVKLGDILYTLIYIDIVRCARTKASGLRMRR